MKSLKLFYLVLFVAVLGACSNSNNPEESEHFASSQQRALEKAKDGKRSSANSWKKWNASLRCFFATQYS